MNICAINAEQAEMLEIVTSISREKGYSFKIATIDAGMNRGLIKERIQTGNVSPCGPVDPLTAEVVDGAVDVVSQMGAEPYVFCCLMTSSSPPLTLVDISKL